MRNYSNTALDTTLANAGGISASATTLTLANATGWPAVPFALVLDPDDPASAEIVLATAGTNPYTVTRGYDGTTAKIHVSGAVIRHAAIADDFRGGVLGGRAVGLTAPSAGQALVWDGGNWVPGTADAYYRHTQTTPATIWTINHALGKNPAITVTDSAGTKVHGEIQYTVPNQTAVVTFSAPFGGTAECS